MSQYKVPQNVEAEDKILGPLTFKQFIYACIGVGWALICFAIFRTLPVVLFVLGFPPTMLFLLLAFYTRDGQNFEQILLALVGFFAASRRRIWVKDSVVETFHVEAAKPSAEATQRNPTETRSELDKLARLIDSRGWNLPPTPDTNHLQPAVAHSDRLVAPPQAAPASDEPTADMLDLQGSPLAQNLSQLLNDAATEVRSQAVNQMSTAPPASAKSSRTSISGVTPENSNDILRLATQGNDLSVSQLAAQATRLAPVVPQGQNQRVEPGPNAS